MADALQWISAALWLMLPIVVGGVTHMYAVAHQWLPALCIPLHRRAFGPNKTWRGLILMPLLTLPGAGLLYLCQPLWPDLLSPLADVNPLVLGVALGLGYILMELPNSFIKRRLGIPAGEVPESGRWLFMLIDQLDSAIGFALAYAWLSSLPAALLVIMVALFPAVALAVKRVLFVLRWKEKAC